MTTPAPLSVAPGRAVRLLYRLSLEGGVAIIAPPEPEWFVVGTEAFPVAMQKSLVGRSAGYSTEVRLRPREAYGDRNPALVLKLPRAQFAQVEPLEKGSRVQTSKNGETASGTITLVTDKLVEVDFNHLLAGATVIAAMKIIEVAEHVPD